MRELIKNKIDGATMNDVDLRDMDITDDEILEIATAIKTKFPQIKNIYLDRNKLGDNGAIALAKVLATLPNLAFLDLQHNAIGEAGMVALTQLNRSTHPNLVLALNGNQIGDVKQMEEIATGRRPTGK